MPFLKFSRDKRGYENYYLFDGKGRPHLLFWFRTPPQVKVGRVPFSDDVRAMVEAQNPGVFFDWARIMSTPIPSADAEHWRERRRAEKAAKQAAREADAEPEIAEEAAPPAAAADEPAGAQEDGAGEDAAPDDAGVATVSSEAEPQAAASDVQAAQPGHRRRRRRRRGRRGGGPLPPGAGVAVTDVAQTGSAPPPEPETPSNDEV